MNWFLHLPKPLVLASLSPRQAQLLRQVGLEFEVVPSGIEEQISDDLSPERQTVQFAIDKAKDVASRVENRIVVGADTIVYLEGRHLGKPADLIEASNMLRILSGKTHIVYTGIAIVDVPSLSFVSDFESTEVTFRELSYKEIEFYVSHDNPIDKAGAYGIQDRSALFVDKIEGCYNNVVGFPLTRFYIRLKEFLEDIP